MRRPAAVPITPRQTRLMPPNPFCPESPFGLDDLPSRIVVTETNDFLWPAPALRARRKPARFDYGMPPPRFFALVRDVSRPRVLVANGGGKKSQEVTCGMVCLPQRCDFIR